MVFLKSKKIDFSTVVGSVLFYFLFCFYKVSNLPLLLRAEGGGGHES